MPPSRRGTPRDDLIAPLDRRIGEDQGAVPDRRGDRERRPGGKPLADGHRQITSLDAAPDPTSRPCEEQARPLAGEAGRHDQVPVGDAMALAHDPLAIDQEDRRPPIALLLHRHQLRGIGRKPHTHPARGVPELPDGPRREIPRHDHVEGAQRIARVEPFLDPGGRASLDRQRRRHWRSEVLEPLNLPRPMPDQLRELVEADPLTDEPRVIFPPRRRIIGPERRQGSDHRTRSEHQSAGSGTDRVPQRAQGPVMQRGGADPCRPAQSTPERQREERAAR